jgi:hypothetical protein
MLGNEVSITMFTRRDWEESVLFSDRFDRIQRRMLSGVFASKGSDYQFVCSFTMRSGLTGDFIGPSMVISDRFRAREYAVAGTALVLELTSAPSFATLRSAVTWMKAFSEPSVFERVVERLNLPAPGVHATGNELAFFILDVLKLSFEIRLVGLQKQSHLNGKVGTVLGFDTRSTLRMKVCVNGADLSVLSQNLSRAPLGFKRKKG